MERKFKVFAIIIALLGASVGIAVFLAKQKKEPQANNQVEHKRYVKAKAVEYKTLPGLIETSGRLLSNNEVVLTSSVAGYLNGDVNSFKVGQNFKKGDLLVTVVDNELTYSHYAKKSNFLKTLATLLPDLKIDFPDQYDKWFKFFNSVEIKNSLPTLPEISNGKERIYLASKSILSDYYSLKSEEAKLEKYYVRAPFNGSIKEVTQQIGAYVNGGMKLAVISMTESYEIEVPVSTTEVSFVKKNQKVEIVNEQGDVLHIGKVLRMSDVLNANTQSISVFCRVDKSENEMLFDGLYHKVILHGTPIDNVVSIPRNALYNGNQIFVVQEAKAVKKIVSVIKLNKETAYINGLEEGEELVVEPLINLGDNSNFEVIR